MDLGIATVVPIIVICYLIGIGAKNAPIDNKWIPVIVGICGGALGVIALYIRMPDFPVSDIISAIAVGIASGLASTGVHQVGKQLTK